MRKQRQSIPAGLAAMPPGPELAAVLAGIDLSRLSGADCVTVLRAHHREVAHAQAQFMAAIVEVARCGIGPDDQLLRMDAPDEFSADEIRTALAWTRSAANSQLDLAWDLIDRLGQVYAALDAGSIDVPKARVFSEWTTDLTDEQAHHICDTLLPEAPELTTGQLCERIKRMAIALDPDWARRRYEQAVRERRVVGYRNDDGTGTVCGYQLPADRAAAACANIDALAKKIKHAGDSRPIDHIRADLYVRMLDGSYTGMDEAAILADMLTLARSATDAAPASPEPSGGDRTPGDTGRPAGGGSGRATRHDCGTAHARRSAAPGKTNGPANTGTAHPEAAAPSATHGEDGRTSPTPTPTENAARRTGGEVLRHPQPTAASLRGNDQPDRRAGVDPHADVKAPAGAQARAGVEVRVEITTLLGLDRHPAEIAGWGFVHAEVARTLVADQTAGEWRYAITDDDGYLLHEGITRARPSGYPSRAGSPARGGIVELHIRLTELRRLAAQPERTGAWAGVIAALMRQAHRHEASADGREAARSAAQLREMSRRSPGQRMRRRTEIRDRTCLHPQCRAPAHGTDGDHLTQWARGGLTHDDNIGSACRHDHRLKDEGGWKVIRLPSGELLWISRLGIHYPTRPSLIIEPLPDSAPRHPPPPPDDDPPDDDPPDDDPPAEESDDTPIRYEP